jgi:maltooligosyltrehalose trehalohydrolase
MTRAQARTAADAPVFGALPSQDGVLFRIWAPDARSLELIIRDGRAAGRHPLKRLDEGVYETWIAGAAAGDRYAYRIDDEQELPDPASRFQPDGVHGASQIIDATAFGWTDGAFRIRQLQDLIVYELHVGTFSPEGTFAGVRSKLPYLRDLGITAIELMPVADFAGARNWGYDGVVLFAPSRVYGTPDDLRRLVDAAHGHGLAVLVDVVYNHLGPEGAYLPRYARQYLTDKHRTPWGGAVNVDDEGSRVVRRFIIDNAVHWIREYHADGLRLDATHALIDDTTPQIVEELVAAVREAAGREVIVHAEDHRNLASMVLPRTQGGWGLDGVWADDFHHVVRRMVAGDAHSYFSDFEGTCEELARVLRQGWLYTGQRSPHLNERRGTDPSPVPMLRSVVCLQNHDQVGNRATGDRLHHTIPPEKWRAASVVLLTSPMTPLLFMGQEWAASSPFQYFTDLEPELGRLVTAGRRQEFAAFPEFSDPWRRERIPDPQAATTFENSRLRWTEQAHGDHARCLALYRALLALRRDDETLAGDLSTHGVAVPAGDGLVVKRTGRDGSVWIVACLTGGGEIDLVQAGEALGHDLRHVRMEVLLDTEHAEFTADPVPVDMPAHEAGILRFRRAGAVIMRQR